MSLLGLNPKDSRSDSLENPGADSIWARLFSLKGRVGRGEFWIVSVILGVLGGIVVFLMHSISGSSDSPPPMPAMAFLFALFVPPLMDRDCNASEAMAR